MVVIMINVKKKFMMLKTVIIFLMNTKFNEYYLFETEILGNIINVFIKVFFFFKYYFPQTFEWQYKTVYT